MRTTRRWGLRPGASLAEAKQARRGRSCRKVCKRDQAAADSLSDLRPTPMVSRYLFRGRRRSGRRASEQNGQYVDRPQRRVLATCLVVLLLSIGDAYVTLRMLSAGASEANPLSAFTRTGRSAEPAS